MIAESIVAALCAAAIFLAARAALALPPVRAWPAHAGASVLAPAASGRWRRWLEREVVRAGLGGVTSAGEVAGWQLLLGLGGVGMGVFACATGLPILLTVLVPVAAALLPALRLRDRGKRREMEIGRTLPWTLDLLGLAVEVGVDFNVALVRVVERGRRGPWAEELAQVVREIRLGSSRQEALEALRQRSGHPSVGRFCTAVVQADRLGTPLRRVLQAQAVDLRLARCQRAEKMAGEAPVKLLLPLLGCIFPTVFLVLLGPIAFSVLFGGGIP